MKNNELFTIYTSGAFGVQKIEGKILDFGTKPYAQYKEAVFVHYIPKGKRKPTGFVVGYRPYVVILEGIGHPEPDDAFGPSKDDGVLITKQTRYSSFDERYSTEFDQKIEKYLSDKKPLLDIRHTVNTNVINK